MSRVITFACHKGGVGKTTSAVTFGSILAAAGKKVLMVDLDSQCNTTNMFLPDNPSDDTIYDAFVRARKKKQYQIPVYTVRKNLDLVPSCDDVDALEGELLSMPVGREVILKNLLEPARQYYDYIIIDSSANVGCLLANALTASTDVLIPLPADGFSAKGFTDVDEIVQLLKQGFNPDIRILGLFLTRFNKNRTADRIVFESLLENRKDLLCKSVIRECSDFSKATLVKKDILQYKPKSRAVEDYVALIKETLKVKLPSF